MSLMHKANFAKFLESIVMDLHIGIRTTERMT